MPSPTLRELRSLEAVITEGGFQAAAVKLGRSHTAVFAAVAKLEAGAGFALLDRSGYRVGPTEAGLSFAQKARAVLDEMDALARHVEHLALGEETALRVIIGDICPLEAGLDLIGGFFSEHPATRLDLRFESVGGPSERLLADEADLILQWVDQTDDRLEWLELGTIAFVPVVAPGFLPSTQGVAITSEQLRPLMQCVIRDTATAGDGGPSFFVLKGAPQCIVGDHHMKRAIIRRGLAWGHLPEFMIQADLRDGHLLSIASDRFPGIRAKLMASRRRDRPHGPVAERLWTHIASQAASFGLGADPLD